MTDREFEEASDKLMSIREVLPQLANDSHRVLEHDALIGELRRVGISLLDPAI